MERSAQPPPVPPGSERRLIDQYLQRYAEPEVAYASELVGEYDAAVVVPLAAEEPGCLDGLTPALARRAGELPVLLVAVVNGRSDAPASVEAKNQVLLADWRARARTQRVLRPLSAGAEASRCPARAELLGVEVPRGTLDVLVLDAATDTQRFPPKQGVGLARRIGCDLTVALARSGQLRARYIGAADGDVSLPESYVRALCRPPASAALLFPFEHTSSGDENLDVATELVELTWRYYLLGTAWAGSPFAYHSLGSCLAPEIVSYARVRGYPRRQAAEDFHLLAKLAKVGELDAPNEPCVRIAARRSTRVPFGTGQAVDRLLRRVSGETDEPSEPHGTNAPSDAYLLHDPRVFLALRLLIDALRRVALESPDERVALEPSEHDSFAGGAATAGELPHAVRQLVDEHAQRWRGLLAGPLAGCPTGAHRLHRTFEAFDALAVLRAVHAFRDAGLPPVPWRVALSRAPFLRFPAGAPPRDALEAAREAERLLPPRRGLGSPRYG